MTFGQILERISHILRTRWKTLSAIGLVPIGILAIFESVLFGGLYLAGVFKQPPVMPSTAVMLSVVFPAWLVFMPLIFVMYGLYYGASSYASLQVDTGQPITVSGAYRHAWSKLGRYSWLMLLRSLIVALPFIGISVLFLIAAAFVPALAKGGDAGTGVLFLLVPLGMLLFIGGFIYAIIVGLRLSLAFCACVHEGLTARQAITRSGILTNGAKGRIFLILLVIYAISYAAMMVFYVIGLIVSIIVVGVAGLSSQNAHTTPLGYFAIGLVIVCAAILFILFATLLMAAYSAAFAVLYRDQCLRTGSPMAIPAAIPPPFPPTIPDPI